MTANKEPRMDEKPAPEVLPEIAKQILQLMPALEDPALEHAELVVKEGQWPYYVYSDYLCDLEKLLYKSKIIYSFNWPDWQDVAIRYYEDPTLIETADLDTVRKLLITHVRKDRFCDGHLGAMLHEGHLTAILHRLEGLLGL